MSDKETLNFMKRNKKKKDVEMFTNLNVKLDKHVSFRMEDKIFKKLKKNNIDISRFCRAKLRLLAGEL